MNVRTAWPALRRRPRRPTPRTLGADIFAEHADATLDGTRRVLDAIASGALVPERDEQAPDFVARLQRHQRLVLADLDEELLLGQLLGRMRRIAAVRELEALHPDLVAEALSTRSAVTTRAGTTTEEEA